MRIGTPLNPERSGPAKLLHRGGRIRDGIIFVELLILASSWVGRTCASASPNSEELASVVAPEKSSQGTWMWAKCSWQMPPNVKVSILPASARESGCCWTGSLASRIETRQNLTAQRTWLWDLIHVLRRDDCDYRWPAAGIAIIVLALCARVGWWTREKWMSTRQAAAWYCPVLLSS